MAYEQEIYKKVLNAFEAKRMVEASERKRRLFEVYEKCAEVKQIDEEIDRVGSGAALEILKDPQNAPAIADDLKESMQMLSAMRARALEKAGFARDYTDMRYIRTIFSALSCRRTRGIGPSFSEWTTASCISIPRAVL